MLRLVLLPIYFFILVSLAQSQIIYTISGKVLDSRSKEPLPFVNIVLDNSNRGGTTDIDGKFSIKTPNPVRNIRFSYVGYEEKTISADERRKDIQVLMVKKEIDLREVEILPGVNPAHRIIQNVIDNREFNDPEKLKSFSYTAYDKTVFTLDNDTTFQGDFSALVDTSGKQDGRPAVEFELSVDSTRSDSVRRDSINRSIEKFIENQYLFLMENVTKRKFMAPDRNFNKVIATKVSGFRDPVFVFLTTQIQSFSFYKPFISILMKQYINPIGGGALAKYFFKIEDTAYRNQDTVFIISFRPKKGTNFDGMKGLISINSRGWAIQNVVAEPYPFDGGMSVRIHQMYELIDDRQWFPVQLNTDLVFNNMRAGKYKAVGRGRSYIRDIVLNPEMVRREFNHLDTEVDQDATNRGDQYWNQYRIDSLTHKDKRTYHILDSIGRAENFDKTAQTIQTLITGRIPWGPVDLEISRFLGYNTYEGVIAGLGLHTNDRLSERLRFGGYFQFAFAVLKPKYGIDAGWIINKRRELSVTASYFDDLSESGAVRFPTDRQSFITGDFRQLLLKKLDQTKDLTFSIKFRGLTYFLFNFGMSVTEKKSTTFDFVLPDDSSTFTNQRYHFTTLTAGFKWAYGEKFVQTTKSRFSLGTRFPVVWLQYTHGFNDLLGGEYLFNRLDIKISKLFNIKYLGKLTIELNGGIIDQSVPACNLFYAPGTWRELGLFAQNSFSTMRNNEFLSDRFVSVYMYHDFGTLLFRSKSWFHPEFALAQNIGFSWLAHPEYYQAISDNLGPMDLGFYESGLLINNLVNLRLYNIGIGCFYRWGPLSLDSPWNNTGLKLTLRFPF
jgi:hypothetical protein